MIRKLPSLHFLHVFDAAGRHESFKLAANELQITPSAVSHQIKALEEQLGFQLFLRCNRKLELTRGGSVSRRGRQNVHRATRGYPAGMSRLW